MSASVAGGAVDMLVAHGVKVRARQVWGSSRAAPGRSDFHHRACALRERVSGVREEMKRRIRHASTFTPINEVPEHTIQELVRGEEWQVRSC
jgi:hypothetical protein